MRRWVASPGDGDGGDGRSGAGGGGTPAEGCSRPACHADPPPPPVPGPPRAAPGCREGSGTPPDLSLRRLGYFTGHCKAYGMLS